MAIRDLARDLGAFVRERSPRIDAEAGRMETLGVSSDLADTMIGMVVLTIILEG